MMTGFLHEKQFSRKSFVKGGGALVVGFSLAGSALAGKASRPPPMLGRLPARHQLRSTRGSRSAPTTPSTLKTSQIEIGNGITTGFLQVLAEELDMDMSQMFYGTSDTGTALDPRRHVDVGEHGRRGRLERDVGHRPEIRNAARRGAAGAARAGLDAARRSGRAA